VLIGVLLIGCAAGIRHAYWKNRVKSIIGAVMLIAILADLCMAFSGQYTPIRYSGMVACVYFIGFMGVALYIVPREIGASARAKELEYELQNSRVSIMISQIQPHFLYNVLTSICCLCDKNPRQAKSALIQFSEYLRTNLDSIKCRSLVSIEQELTHVRTYLNLEMMRFDDALNVEYDIGCNHFMLPPLTIQPLVENAVKHGVGRTEKDGTVKIIVAQTENAYEIKVIDDGVGFDTSRMPEDGKQHVGIANVRHRLESMINGKLEIESEIGKGTTAIVTIPR
jgi:sensor histidine kinase YesM